MKILLTILTLTAVFNGQINAHCGSCSLDRKNTNHSHDYTEIKHDKKKKELKSSTTIPKVSESSIKEAKEYDDLMLTEKQEEKYEKLIEDYEEKLMKLEKEFIKKIKKILSDEQFKTFEENNSEDNIEIESNTLN